MLKSLNIIVFALLIALNSYGQNVYQQSSNFGYFYDEPASVFVSDTGFFTLGQGMQVQYVPIDSIFYHDGERRLLMTWYDWQGNVVKQNNFFKERTDYYCMVRGSDNPLYNNGYFHVGAMKDSLTTGSNNCDLFIAKFNFEGDTLWTKRFDSGLYDNGYTGIQTHNGDFVAVSCFQMPSNFSKHRTKIIRFNINGNVKWNKTINILQENEGSKILEDNTGNFFISGSQRISTGDVAVNSRGLLLKIDSTGTLLWSKNIPGFCTESIKDITFDTDGNILAAVGKCYEPVGPYYVNNQYSIYKLSKETGEVIWNKEYPAKDDSHWNVPSFIEKLNNGDILIGGMILDQFIIDGDTLGQVTGGIIRTDSLGDMKWIRYFYMGTDSSSQGDINYMSDGKQTPDNGFILVGRNNNNGWIIKTDEYGCILMDCQIGDGIEELEEDDYRLFIYPNPAQDYVSVDLPLPYNKGTLQIIDMQGRLIKTITINNGGLQHIETSDLANGLYQILVLSKSKLIGKEKLVVAK